MYTASNCKIMQVGRSGLVVFGVLPSHVQQADVGFQADLKVFPYKV